MSIYREAKKKKKSVTLHTEDEKGKMAPLIEFCTSCRERMVAVACGVKILYHIMSSWRHSACNSWAFGDPRTNQQSIGICDPNLNFDPHTCISKLFILKLIRNYQHQICSSGGRFNSNTWIYFLIPVFLSITALPSPRFLKLSIQSAPEPNSGIAMDEGASLESARNGSQSPYHLLFRAVSMLPITHLLLGAVCLFLIFLYNLFETHFLHDFFFRGDTVSLTFNSSSQLYHSVASKCRLLHARWTIDCSSFLNFFCLIPSGFIWNYSCPRRRSVEFLETLILLIVLDALRVWKLRLC